MRKNALQAVLVASFLLVAPSFGQAHTDTCGASAAAKVADVALVRPVSLVVATGTSALWAGLSPLLELTGVSDSWGHYLVVEPWRFTGGRNEGCFSCPGTYQD